MNPCPFCGGELMVPHRDAGRRRYYVKCSQCGARGPTVRRLPKETDMDATVRALSEWNKRITE